jgi:hypothetical protein
VERLLKTEMPKRKLHFNSVREAEIVSLQSSTEDLIVKCHLIQEPMKNSIIDRFKVVTFEFKKVSYVHLPMKFYFDEILDFPIGFFELKIISGKPTDYISRPVFLKLLENHKNRLFAFNAEKDTYGWIIAECYTWHLVQKSKRSRRKSVQGRTNK